MINPTFNDDLATLVLCTVPILHSAYLSYIGVTDSTSTAGCRIAPTAICQWLTPILEDESAAILSKDE